MEKIPTHLKVIEGSVVAANYSTDQVKTLSNPQSYYFLSGEILEASVDKVEKPASVTKRVLTSYKRVENPEYIAWTQLKKRQKKETAEPPSTVEVPVEEDVTIKKSIIEKQGVFSITYRLAESVSAGVAFSDALNKRNSFTGENVEGVELGLFKAESVIADLPSDADMLESLSVEVAVDAAAKIAEQILKLEEAYVKKADAAVISEDFNDAAENYGYRNVLLQAQGEVDEDILSKLRTYAIRWKN
jgi:hypothetical protein